MSKRTMLMVAIALLTIASTAALASLYSWNDAKRPPISLADALARAEKLLDDDAANRYCVSVSLHGNETGDGKEGAWNLLFAATDGSKKHVYINMEGESHVKLWNGPIDWKKNDGRRADLADARRRLEELFAKEGIEAEYEAHPDRLLVKYKAREFQVHPLQKDGTYSEQLERIPGPGGEGIWLLVRIVEKPHQPEDEYSDTPYWSGERYTYFLTEPGKFLSVDLRYGHKAKYEVARQIWDTFGERVPN